MAYEGDKSKQPPECEPRWIEFSAEFPHDIMQDGPNAKGRWTQCPNLKEVGGGVAGERYRCDVCGKSYFLNYDDMR